MLPWRYVNSFFDNRKVEADFKFFQRIENSKNSLCDSGSLIAVLNSQSRL